MICKSHTVDGRNPAPAAEYPSIYKVFNTCRISSINSMTERKQLQTCLSQIRDVKLENKSGVKNIRRYLPVKHILFGSDMNSGHDKA